MGRVFSLEKMSGLCDGELTFKSIATNGYAMFIAMQKEVRYDKKRKESKDKAWS